MIFVIGEKLPRGMSYAGCPITIPVPGLIFLINRD